MLKRISLIIYTTLIIFLLCACSSKKESISLYDIFVKNEPIALNDIFTTNDDNIEKEEFSRVVKYKINDNVMEKLSLDNETIRLLDEIYISTSEAYANLSAKEFYTTVYDAVMAFDNKFQSYLDKLENPTEKEKQFMLEVFDMYSMNSLEVGVAGFEYANGNVSLENAAFDILVATDAILYFMYQDYEPIYQPRVIDVDSIFSMFDENELAAEEELKHQLLCVSGTVYEVSRDMMDQPYVGLATSEGVSHKLLRCYISSNPSDDVMSLEKGDRVSCFLEITDKDTFDINAKLWNIEHYNEDVITDSDRNQNNGVEVELKMASEEVNLSPHEYKIYYPNDLEYGENIILTPNTEISNFKFFVLDGEKLFNNDQYVISEILYTSAILDHDKPFATRIYYEGYFSSPYGISYEDMYGEQHNFVIYESGEDGSFYLEPF